MTADVLRDKFLNFFKSRKHKIVSSDSLIPADDPTVLFTPAGMNQFKKQFLGHISGFKRAVTSQRCLRTDDLDKVGKTSGHHTLFEMLGNFSFGDYFKEEAIAWAWEFLTAELKIKEEKLWVSVYKDDNEAYKIWRDKIKVSPQKIIKLGDKENFWPSEAKEKGPNGPCGPCSEIFFDFGKTVGCGRPDCNPSCGCGRFVEVWNLVFTQFNREEGGRLKPLPKKNIDTGMGLERLAAVMQGASNNFETDLFAPIIKEIISVLGFANTEHRTPNTELIYAVADHIRAIVFAIYDGVLPSNESRGYVIRKLIRKAALHLRALGRKQPFLYKLVPLVCEIMKTPYPKLSERRENIAGIILAEEKSFISALDSSDVLLKEKFSQVLRNPDPQNAGRLAFQLYDTHGIPLELTRDWLNKHNIEFSREAFDRELQGQKERSKLTSSMKGDVFSREALKLDIPATKFSGYKDFESGGKILKIIKDAKEAKKITAGEEASIILDRTAFYAESGGQVGDTGNLVKGRNIFEVSDTQKKDKLIIHIGRVKQGNFRKSDLVSAKIDIERRLSIARNHSATHLLQAALRKILGAHVQQQGSLVSDERFRFDFTHFKDISPQELSRIEETVNEYVIGNFPLLAKEMPLSAAQHSGALAFFAEKYEGRVRVVSIGDFSKELCAGTHLGSTGSIGIFKITHEGSVASGIRRIEAVTAKAAFKLINEEESVIKDVSSLLNVPREKIAGELEKRLVRIKELDKQLSSQKLDIIENSISELLGKKESVNNINIITSLDDNRDMDALRKAVDMLKQKTDNTVIALGSRDIANSRALLVIGVTADLTPKGLDAGQLIRAVAGDIGGSGGGRNDFAQAGGNKPENFEKAFQKLKNIIMTMK